MFLLYGEGGIKVFLCLQQEILNFIDDYFIFLWIFLLYKVVYNELWGLLVEFLSWFFYVRWILQFQYFYEDDCLILFCIINCGLFLEFLVVDLDKDGVGDVLFFFSCDIEFGILFVIIVRKIDGMVNDEYVRIFVGVLMVIKLRRIVIWEDIVVDEVMYVMV